MNTKRDKGINIPILNTPLKTLQKIRLLRLEREPLMYCKSYGKVNFPRPSLSLGKVTFDVIVVERLCNGDILDAFPKY